MTEIYDSYPDISIHAPRAGSDFSFTLVLGLEIISIHAPRAGSDYAIQWYNVYKKPFQSTLPVRGATVKIRIFIRIFK